MFRVRPVPHITQERTAAMRLVTDAGHHLVLAPYASRVPFEVPLKA